LSVWALVAAAGSGERFGADRPKAFAKLRDLPLLAESLGRLEASDWIDGIVVAAPAGWLEPAVLVAEEIGAGKVTACVEGGSTRTASVRAAAAELPEDAVVALVHDAARPLLADDLLGRVLAPLSEGWDGAVPALPIADTIKRVRGQEIVETVEREELVIVQTPQAFLAPVLRDALTAGTDATDCAALVEARGGRVKVVPGDRLLFKVTTQDDLDLVERCLDPVPE
jgi:2-C-methyl-D-erythritol 4-phosphate cytidylyltransferase